MKKKEDILDIAMNLNRVGNWAADDYKGKKSRIETFINNTTTYIENLDYTYEPPFKETLDLFLKDYPSLKNEGINGPKDPLYWAERMMTWGNILTHRASLIK